MTRVVNIDAEEVEAISMGGGGRYEVSTAELEVIGGLVKESVVPSGPAIRDG